MNRILMKRIMLIFCVMLLSSFLCVSLFAEENDEAAVADESLAVSLKHVAAAFAVGLSCIAGGIAVGRIGSAAMGAMSENPELFGKALPLVALAEGICLWGFLVALLIIFL